MLEFHHMQVKKDEAAMRSQMSNNSATLPGLNLPATQDLLTNLEKFRKGFINYLQIKLDTGLFFFLLVLDNFVFFDKV